MNLKLKLNYCIYICWYVPFTVQSTEILLLLLLYSQFVTKLAFMSSLKLFLVPKCQGESYQNGSLGNRIIRKNRWYYILCTTYQISVLPADFVYSSYRA